MQKTINNLVTKELINMWIAELIQRYDIDNFRELSYEIAKKTEKYIQLKLEENYHLGKDILIKKNEYEGKVDIPKLHKLFLNPTIK